MAIIEDRDLLEVLACDIAVRPPAPGPDDLRPFITGVTHDGDGLRVRFDNAGASLVAAFVEAERQCCPEIGWELVAGPALRISATPEQLIAIKALFDSRSVS